MWFTNITVIWDGMLCSLVEKYRHIFRRTCCLHHLPDDRDIRFLHMYPYAKLHGITSQETMIMIPPEEPQLSLLFFIPCPVYFLSSFSLFLPPPSPPPHTSTFSCLVSHPVAPLLLFLPACLPLVYHVPYHLQAVADTAVIQITCMSNSCYIPKHQHLHMPLGNMALVINDRILTT